MGVSYCQLRCFQEAVEAFQRALGPAAQQPPLMAKVLHNLGAALNSVGRFSAAVGYHRLAAGLYGETLPRSITFQTDQSDTLINQDANNIWNLLHVLKW